MPAKSNKTGRARATRIVSEEVFRQVYDSPYSLPGKEKWVTSEEDVRIIERLLGMAPKTIGAPLWVSGDTKSCPTCGRETNWLDIIASGVAQAHSKELLIRVILGDKKYVNIEAPRAIANLFCYKCKSSITDLRSFKCHNWAYAIGKIRELVEQIANQPAG